MDETGIHDPHSEINDPREIPAFRGITFSGFSRAKAKKELIQSMYDEKIEQSCYWSAELICAGQHNEVWESIIIFFAKYVHNGNPKLVVYLSRRILNFEQIVANGFTTCPLLLRNNNEFRKLFAELICIMCSANKHHSIDEIKVPATEFEADNMCERLKAPDASYIESIFREDDPLELFVALNELTYSLTIRSCTIASYWTEWIIAFGNAENLKCERRVFVPVAPNHQTHFIWLIWDVFINISSNRHNTLVQRLVESTLECFCFHFRPTNIRKYKLLLYFIIELLCAPVNTNYTDTIIKNQSIITTVTSHISDIYTQIKENQHDVGTDYLFADMDSDNHNSNLENTISQLKTVNQMTEMFTPRT